MHNPEPPADPRGDTRAEPDGVALSRRLDTYVSPREPMAHPMTRDEWALVVAITLEEEPIGEPRS